MKSHYQADRTDAELLKRAEEDLKLNVPEMMGKRLLEDTGPSFDKAWQELRSGNPIRFALKSGSVAMGSFLMADGIYHMISGADEEVEDLFLSNHPGANWTRIATGLGEVGLGAGMVYLGLTKGPVLGK
jgi:hypothetical protein